MSTNWSRERVAFSLLFSGKFVWFTRGSGLVSLNGWLPAGRRCALSLRAPRSSETPGAGTAAPREPLPSRASYLTIAAAADHVHLASRQLLVAPELTMRCAQKPVGRGESL